MRLVARAFSIKIVIVIVIIIIIVIVIIVIIVNIVYCKVIQYSLLKHNNDNKHTGGAPAESGLSGAVCSFVCYVRFSMFYVYLSMLSVSYLFAFMF